MNASTNSHESDWRARFSPHDLQVYESYRPPRPTEPTWSNPALLIVDVTLAFLGPHLPTADAAAVLRTACGNRGWHALPTIQRLLHSFRAHHLPVAFATPLPRGEGGAPAAVDKYPLAEMPAQIEPIAGEEVFRKPKASALFGSALPIWLMSRRPEPLVVAGTATSGCVRATAVDASAFGLQVVVASDSCFDRSELSHDVALFEMDVKYAWVMTTDSIARHL